jgi:uncharacterized protein (TIGR03083 family)
MGAMMAGLDFDRYCSEIVTQTKLLAAAIDGADMTVEVPSCPGWNVGQLVRHLGGAQRWAAEMVRTAAAEPLPDSYFRDLSGYTHEDPAALVPWLLDSAITLADVLGAAGPDSAVGTGPIPDGVAAFYARRFTHETAMRRADATLALGRAYALERDVAIDGVDEWMRLGSLPTHFELHPWTRELLGPGRTMHFHATDTTSDDDAEWVFDLTGDMLTWRRGHEKAAVAVRGPVTELLLVIYKRRSPRDGTVEVLGEHNLLDFWLDRMSFG